jgi:hypothetical protein
VSSSDPEVRLGMVLGAVGENDLVIGPVDVLPGHPATLTEQWCPAYERVTAPGHNVIPRPPCSYEERRALLTTALGFMQLER